MYKNKKKELTEAQIIERAKNNPVIIAFNKDTQGLDRQGLIDYINKGLSTFNDSNIIKEIALVVFLNKNTPEQRRAGYNPLIDIRITTADAILIAKRIGELLKELPQAQAKGNQYTGKIGGRTAVSTDQNTKQAIKQEFGITDKQAQRYETLAKHKDIVEKAKAEKKWAKQENTKYMDKLKGITLEPIPATMGEKH